VLEHPSHHAAGHNPLCGDHIEVARAQSARRRRR
jgi:hypothetical protein